MSKRIIPLLLAVVLCIGNVIFGVPGDALVEAWNRSKIVDALYLSLHDSRVVDTQTRYLPKFVQKARAANFSIQTGYYIGNGGTQNIAGVGFQPQFVLIKSDTNTGQATWKTSVMPASNTAFFSATANNTSSLMSLSANGFSVANNPNINTANVRYTWTAFAGSDCTASGTMCVGTYTGNGTSPRKITTGFGPAFVMVKHSSTTAANFRTTSMAANMGQYFTTSAQDTAGALYTTLDADGFNIGATNNTNTNTYYYVAFKAVSGIMGVGTYTGNGVDNRDITGFGVGSTPNFALVKNATSATVANRAPQTNNTQSYGDYAGYLSAATANAVNMIQKLQSDGFQVGTGVQTNENLQTFYWVAFGGGAAPPGGSGSFTMATGTYTGNGTSVSVTGLSFAPDLVIIKDTSTNYAVFRTKLMAGDVTVFLANPVASFATAITGLTADGFTIGSSTVTNTSAGTYYWQAFGNAYSPTTRSGAADFVLGAYTGNGIDSRNIVGQPFQPDMVTIKRSGASAATWRTSAQGGDVSSFFAATAEAANNVQTLQSDGFQVGTSANTNTAGNLYYWFGFKNGSNFTVGSYTGSGANQNVNAGFQPDTVWVKRSTTAAGAVHRSTPLAGDSTQNFLNTANFASGITALISSGFSLTSTTAATNASGGTYRYAAWRIATSGTLNADIVDGSGASVANPGVSFGAVSAMLACQTGTGTLGTALQKIRVTNGTGNGNWTLTAAATGGNTANWSNGTRTYDFNDGNASGCSDGGDADSIAGQLNINPTAGTLTPQAGCSSGGVSKGASSGFSQGVTDSISLLTAASSQTNCYYELTDVGLSQQIPAETPANASAYTINITITVTAN